jgi:hypothetical protein
MTTRNYLILCGTVSAAWLLGLLFVPGFSDAVEQAMLLFLSRTAG